MIRLIADNFDNRITKDFNSKEEAYDWADVMIAKGYEVKIVGMHVV